jgi:hypothetical protein
VNPSLEIIVIERCSTGGCPLEEACEHFYLNQSAFSIAISYIISVYCEDYVGYFTVILSFLAFHFCFAYFIYLVSCKAPLIYWHQWSSSGWCPLEHYEHRQQVVIGEITPFLLCFLTGHKEFLQ